MLLVTAKRDLRREVEAARAAGRSVGFVPTMGYLHQGHLSLVARARAETDYVVVSIFVNPLQFGPTEDYQAYPRDLEGDLSLCREAGVDLVFAPEEGEMYPERLEVSLKVGRLAQRLCGLYRPGHFDGVATVVAKLFNLVGPGRAYFGEKDYQQLVIVRRIVTDLDFPVEVVGCPTVREPDGLAMSSRNTYLSEEERGRALALYRSLVRADLAFREGERRVARLKELALETMAGHRVTPEYWEVVDPVTLEPLEEAAVGARALVAARVGRARLIDNLALGVG